MQIEENYFKKIVAAGILLFLIVLSFFLIKPILISIIFGAILAFIFLPVYRWINKYVKSKDLSAFLICILLLVLIIVPIWFMTPLVLSQSVEIYIASQQIDFVKPLENIFPSLFVSETFSKQIGLTVSSFVTGLTTSMMNSISEMIMNFPILFLQMVVALFVFFFVLRDKDKLMSYVKSLMPFSREVEKKLFKSSKDITISVLYGQVVIGVVQGIIAGIGYLLFKVPNALILIILTALAGIFPIIGTAIIWVPVAVYLLIAGNTFAALGVTIFGVLSSVLENFLKPVFISKRTKMNSSLVIIGMIGGLFLFGILGIILGPLVLAYLFIILEIYRNKKTPGIVIQSPENGK